MNKCEFEALLVNYINGELAAKKKSSLKRHLKECSNCRSELKRISSLHKDMENITVPYPSKNEWEGLVDRALGKRTLRLRPVLIGVSLAAAAIAVVVIIDKSTPPTKTSAVVAEAGSSKMQCSGGPLRPPPRPEDAAIVKSGEGERPNEGILAKDSYPTEERSVGPPRPTPRAERVVDESPLRFQGAALAKERRGDLQRSPARSSGAAETANRIPGEPVPTSTITPIPEQKDKVVIKHNRINPSLGEKMTVSVKSDTRELISIRIYSKSGKPVRTLVNQEVSPGIHEFRWDGTNDSGAVLASGIYFIVIEAPGFKLKEKAVVLK